MIDVESRARRAGDAARSEAAERVHALEVPARRSRQPRGRHVARPLAGALVGALVVLLIVLLSGGPRLPGTVTIEPAAPDLSEMVTEPVAVDGVLPVPPVGEAIPAYLEDGTPVFVSHPADGEVFVLEAFDGHGPGGIHEMVHWCPTSGQFEEARHSTRFNAYGDYAGGPAPRALLDVPAEPLADGTVRVTGPPGPARARTDVRAEVPMRGPPCLGTEEQLTEDAVSHERPAEVPELDGSALPQQRWVWTRVRLGGPEGDPRVCELDGRCPAAAPRVGRGWGQVPAFDPSELTMVLARGDGSDARLALGPDPSWSRLPAVGGEYVTRSLPVPAPGGVALEQLDDGAPVVVTHGTDGGLHVLDAAPPEQHLLVAACTAAGFLTDGSGAVWTLDGSAVGETATDDLGVYPFEVVEADDARALRVTGPLASPPPSGRVAEVATGGCPGELRTHRPGEDQAVADRLSPRTASVPGAPSWYWIEARVAEIEGELVLCAYLGPDRCGEPVPTDDTNADCYDDLPTGGVCADRDPVVVTPGVSPTDGPVLMLARRSDDGTTVEVLVPAELGGP